MEATEIITLTVVVVEDILSSVQSRGSDQALPLHHQQPSEKMKREQCDGSAVGSEHEESRNDVLTLLSATIRAHVAALYPQKLHMMTKHLHHILGCNGIVREQSLNQFRSSL